MKTPKWISARHLARMEYSLELAHDIILLPPVPDRWEIRAMHLNMQKLVSSTLELRRLIPAHLRECVFDRPEPWPGIVLHFENLYVNDHVSEYPPDAPDPDWFELLPRNVRGFYRLGAIHRVIHGERWYYSPIPYTGLHYLMANQGFSRDIDEAFRLGRLNHIRQLGYLHDTTMKDAGIHDMATRFPHSRGSHSHHVPVIGVAIGRNNNLSEHDLLTLHVACQTHDATTPGGGDTTKMIDPQGLCEEANYPLIFQKPGWPALRDHYSLREQELIDIVHGKGLLGQILDVADKIAYTASDIENFLSHDIAPEPDLTTGVYQAVDLIIRSSNNPLGVWDCVKIVDDQLIFCNPDRLYTFLRLRALMSVGLYYHPRARFWETVFAKVILQYLYDRGTITRDWLLKAVDFQVDHVIDTFVGIPLSTTFIGGLGEPRVETFESLDAARARERQLINDGIVFTVVDDYSKRFKTGSHFIVCERGKCRRTFAEARPEETQELERLRDSLPRYRVYYLVNPQIKPRAMKALAVKRAQDMRNRTSPAKS